MDKRKTKKFKEKMRKIALKDGRKPPHRKGHKLSDEHKKKLRKAHKGKKLSEEHKKKLGRKGGNSGSFKKGHKLNIGRKLTKEHRENLSKAKMRDDIIKDYPIDWTKTLRIAIRERDKYICQICGEKQADKAHSVHHIDYDKNNSDPKNLVTLCVSCHMKTNYKRDYWIKYFKYATDHS